MVDLARVTVACQGLGPEQVPCRAACLLYQGLEDDRHAARLAVAGVDAPAQDGKAGGVGDCGRPGKGVGQAGMWDASPGKTVLLH